MRTERDAHQALQSTAPRPGYVRKMPSSGKRLAAAVLVASFYLGVAALVVWGVMRLGAVLA